MTNIGLDFSLLRRKITASIDVYNKVTENLFTEQNLSRTSGVAALDINAGTVRNRGIELDLNADIISAGDLRFSVGGNASYNKNEIIDLGGVSEFETGTSIIRKGLPLGTHYIVRWGGVNQATGDPLYYDAEGNLTSDYNDATMSVAEFGTWLPKVTGGFNGFLSYKGVYVNAFFNFVSGSKRFNNEDYFNEAPGFATSNQSTTMLQRWRKPGDVTNIARFGTNRNFSSRDIQDASYLRFRNLNVGYNVPSAVIKRFPTAYLLFKSSDKVKTYIPGRSGEGLILRTIIILPVLSIQMQEHLQ